MNFKKFLKESEQRWKNEEDQLIFDSPDKVWKIVYWNYNRDKEPGNKFILLIKQKNDHEHADEDGEIVAEAKTEDEIVKILKEKKLPVPPMMFFKNLMGTFAVK